MKFGTDSGTELGSVSQSDWTTKITNNSQLWDSITTVMNSLAYNGSLNTNAANETGMVANNGEWPTTGASSPNWGTNNLTKEELTGQNKWFTNVDGTTGPTTLSFDLTNNNNEASRTKSVYKKHNNIVWEWKQVLTPATTGTNHTVSITLSTHSTTTPNIYKGTKNVVGDTPNDQSTAKPKDTAYTFKTWVKPETGATINSADYGVSFTFKITA